MGYDCIMPTIKFTDITGVVPEDYYPTPSKAHIPEWLKRLSPYSDQKKYNQTAKRCMPMLDAVMAGYTIVLSEDIRVERDEKKLPDGWGSKVSKAIAESTPVFRWSSGLGVDFHTPDQVKTHSRSTTSIPKWLNPWSIQTPRGYSCLFVSPLNNDRLPFTPFAGVVDTDTYLPVVNFPFLLTDPKFEGTVEAGTPIVQVIPFQREAWKMETSVGNNQDIVRAQRRLNSKFKGGYRNLFRSPKSFD